MTTRHGGPPGTVVSAIAHEDGTRYRVVSDVRPAGDATPLEPTLGDGYLALTCAVTIAG